MSLTARLRLAIVTFVTIVVVAVSALYLYGFTRAAFEAASLRSRFIADQVKGYVLERIDDRMAARPAPPASVSELKAAWTEIVRTDPAITAMLQRALAYASEATNIGITR